MKVIYEEHVAVRKKPLNLQESDLHLFKDELERKIRETHVLTLHDVYLVNSIIFSLSRLKFYTSYTYPPFDNFGLKSIGLNLFILLKMSKFLFPTKKESLLQAVWIADRRSNEYFHWLTDALPRLVVAKDFVGNHPLVLPEHYKKYRYITESLKLFDIPVRFCESSTKLKIHELILPSHTAMSGNYNKVVINKLRDIFLLRFKDTAPNRLIYISRKKAQKRKVANEDDVVALLEKFKYEVHYFEDYSFEQQVRICAQTKSLIGLHGAGLTNMLFMQAHGQVLELRNENDCHNNCYFSLASDLSIDYYYQLSKGNKNDTHTVDVSVDLNELQRNLELMKASSK